MATSYLDSAANPTASWTRHVPLSDCVADRFTEIWQFQNGERSESWEVDVRIGKPLDVIGLKGTSLDETRSYASFLAETAQRLYAPSAPKRPVLHCPCCAANVSTASTAFTAFQVPYRRCSDCGHVFVANQPTAEVLAQVFGESDEHACTYTDPAVVELRMQQVVCPKLDWSLDVFRRHHGRRAASAVDVGAGGGHFVEACRRQGLDAEGYEISAASRTFASQTFGLDLNPSDFLNDRSTSHDIDLVTMWGLLEYTPEPCRFLAAARRRIRPDGLLVVEVPRFDCLGTAVQAANPTRIARHMDPTSHVNCFSDSSLATALDRSGFRIVAAWYFGMDAYELLVQIGLQLNDQQAFQTLTSLIPTIQSALDRGRLCDDIIVAAVPT